MKIIVFYIFSVTLASSFVDTAMQGFLNTEIDYIYSILLVIGLQVAIILPMLLAMSYAAWRLNENSRL